MYDKIGICFPKFKVFECTGWFFKSYDKICICVAQILGFLFAKYFSFIIFLFFFITVPVPEYSWEW